MALYYDLPVYRDTYQLILKIFEVTKDFPKDYKYTLGQDMKRDALQLVRSIYRANKSTAKKCAKGQALFHWLVSQLSWTNFTVLNFRG
jgi:hypothetical protein